MIQLIKLLREAHISSRPCSISVIENWPFRARVYRKTFDFPLREGSSQIFVNIILERPIICRVVILYSAKRSRCLSYLGTCLSKLTSNLSFASRRASLIQQQVLSSPFNRYGVESDSHRDERCVEFEECLLPMLVVGWGPS
jgi:hypothetical protein